MDRLKNKNRNVEGNCARNKFRMNSKAHSSDKNEGRADERIKGNDHPSSVLGTRTLLSNEHRRYLSMNTSTNALILRESLPRVPRIFRRSSASEALSLGLESASL